VLRFFAACWIVGLAAGAQPHPDVPASEKIARLRKGMSPADVRQLLGKPPRVARQILYQRHREQWLYSEPEPIRLDFDCPRGQEAWLLGVTPLRPGRP
jgi:hypothetical protein